MNIINYIIIMEYIKYVMSLIPLWAVLRDLSLVPQMFLPFVWPIFIFKYINVRRVCELSVYKPICKNKKKQYQVRQKYYNTRLREYYYIWFLSVIFYVYYRGVFSKFRGKGVISKNHEFNY